VVAICGINMEGNDRSVLVCLFLLPLLISCVRVVLVLRFRCRPAYHTFLTYFEDFAASLRWDAPIIYTQFH
jgi:hypothetical protein